VSTTRVEVAGDFVEVCVLRVPATLWWTWRGHTRVVLTQQGGQFETEEQAEQDAARWQVTEVAYRAREWVTLVQALTEVA
jgi:hypothetical protein